MKIISSFSGKYQYHYWAATWFLSFIAAIGDCENITVEHFREYSLQQLKNYLGQRRIRADGRQGKLAVLAYWAWKLKVPVNPTELETQENSKKILMEILTGEDGQRLPRPDDVDETEWKDGSRKHHN